MTDIPPSGPRWPAPSSAPRADRKAPAGKAAGKGAPAAGASTEQPRNTLAADSFSRAVAGPGGVMVQNPEGPRALIRFGVTGSATVQGELRQGGRVTLEYNPVRLFGAPPPRDAGMITAHVRFLPRAEVHDRPCVEVEVMLGRPTGRLRPSPVTMEIPPDATGLLAWFDTRAPQLRADGHVGEPYTFPVKPRARTA